MGSRVNERNQGMKKGGEGIGVGGVSYHGRDGDGHAIYTMSRKKAAKRPNERPNGQTAKPPTPNCLTPNGQTV